MDSGSLLVENDYFKLKMSELGDAAPGQHFEQTGVLLM